MKETTAQERVWQFFFVVARNDHDGPVLRFYELFSFVNEKLHSIQFEQQVIRKLDVRLVDSLYG